MLEAVVEYAESNHCRRAIILRYFGDPDASRVVECCDNCPTLHQAPQAAAPARSTAVKPGAPAPPSPADLAHLTSGERAALIVLDCIATTRVKVGRAKLAQILHGSRAREILLYHHNRNPHYAKLAAVQQGEIETLIGQLVERGLIKAIGGEYPVLHLTPRGEAALKDKERIALKYSRAFTDESVSNAQAKLEAGGTAEYSASLLAQGLTPEQIARQRGLEPLAAFPCPASSSVRR
jgi:ATP-dependent DNA helicase RecQ